MLNMKMVFQNGSEMCIKSGNINVNTDAGSKTMTLWLEQNGEAEEVCVGLSFIDYIKIESVDM